jgi:transmembrane sensor
MRAISGESAISVEAAALPANEVGRELAWREGRLSFEGETLQQAASEFARWSDTRIVIVDARLAAEPVTGLFQANDPVGFAQAVSVAFNARATVGEGQVTLSR